MVAAVMWRCFTMSERMMIKRMMVWGVLAMCGLGGVASAQEPSPPAVVHVSVQVWRAEEGGQLKLVSSPSLKTVSGREMTMEMSDGPMLAVVPTAQGERVCVEGTLGSKGAMRAVSGCFGEEDALVLPLRVGEVRYEVHLSRL
jgi:hypothetical protein